MHSFSVLILESNLWYLVFTFEMPSSPEHLSDRCLSIFFFLHFAQFFQINWYTFSGGGFYPRPVFPGGGGLCVGNYATTPGKIYLRELGSSLRKFKITNSKELKKDRTLPYKIWLILNTINTSDRHFVRYMTTHAIRGYILLILLILLIDIWRARSMNANALRCRFS